MNRKIFNPKSEAGKKGFVNDRGEWLIQPLYDDVDVFREGVCWVKTGDKWGLINEKGDTLIEPRYDDIREFNDGYGNVKLNGKWGVVDKAGDFIFEPQFDFMGYTMEGMTKVKADGKYGFINTKTHEIIIPVYDEVYDFSEGFAAVRLGELWGYIDKKGVEVIKPRYSWVESFRDGSASYVEEWGEIGVLDIVDGRPVHSQPVFGNEDEDSDAYDDKCLGLDDEEPRNSKEYFGCIDRHGNYIVRPIFQKISGFVNEQAVVKIDGKWGMINSLGAYLCEPSSEELKPTNDGNWDDMWGKCTEYIKIQNQGKIGITDKSGKVILPPVYERIIWFHEEGVFAIESAEGKDDAIEAASEEDELKIESAEFWDSRPWRFNFYASTEDNASGKWGICDRDGKVILQPTYPDEIDFCEGLAAVKVDDKWGFINTRGEMVIAPKFEFVEDFKTGTGLSIVTENELHGVINTRGEYIVKPIYNFVDFLGGGSYIWTGNSKDRVCLIDSNGRMVVPPHPSYEFLSESEDMIGYFDAETQLYGFIDGKTGLMTEPLFDEISPFKHGVAVVGFSEQQIEAGEQYKPIVFSQINRDDVCVTILGHRFLSWGVDCVGTKRTGLDRDVLICTRQPDMCPIIIVCKENCHAGQNFYDRAQAFVSISDNPCITASDGSPLPDGIWTQIMNWIRQNKGALLRYWNEEIDTADLNEAISSQGMLANTPQNAS